MPVNPAVDLAAALQTAGHGTVGTTIFSNREAPPNATVPEAAVFVALYSDQPYQGSFKTKQYEARCQVLVRSVIDGDVANETLARAIAKTVDRLTISGYVWCKHLNGPTPLPNDDTNHPRRVVNVSLLYEQ